MTDPEASPRRSLRAHKEIDYTGKNAYAPASNTTSSTQDKIAALPNGKGTKFSELAAWKSIRSDDLTLVHRLVFNRPGTASERKKNLSHFCGFETAAGTREKVVDRLSSSQKAEVQHTLRVFGLSQTGTLKDAAVRLADFLFHPNENKAGSPPSSSSARGANTTSNSSTSSSSPKKRKLNSGDATKTTTTATTTKAAASKTPPAGATTPQGKGKKSTPAAAAASAEKSSPKKRAQSASPAKGKKRAREDESEQQQQQAAPPRALPTREAIASWFSTYLVGKSTQDISKLKLKEIRALTETQFQLPAGAFTQIKQDVLNVIASLTNDDAEQATPEPSVAPYEEGPTRGSRESSMSRTGGDPSLSQPQSEPGIRPGEPHTGEKATEVIQQILDTLLASNASHATGGGSAMPPSSVPPSCQHTPEPSVAQPDSAFYVVNQHNSREVSLSRAAESTPPS